MKKALIITAVAGFIRGFLVNDIKTLHKLGFEVHCAADANNVGADGILDFFDDLDVEFHQIDFNSKKPFSKNTLKAYLEVVDLLNQHEFNLVHSHTPIAGFITRFAAQKYRKNGTKIIYTTHGYYFHKKAPIRDWIVYYPIEYLAAFWSDAIVTINNEDFNCAKKMPCKKCFHINGVGLNTERFFDVSIDRDVYRKSIGVGKDDIMVLAAGELTTRKNHQVIIRALGKLKNNNIVFVVCGRAMQGSGTYNLLQNLAKQENVRMNMLEFRSDMPQICHCADIGVLPSLREGLGMVSLQIMAAGVPMVTSNVHGIVDYMIPDKTGYMYDPMDVDGFAEGIRKLCDKEKRASMTIYCKNMARQFSAEISSEQMKNIYTELLFEDEQHKNSWGKIP